METRSSAYFQIGDAHLALDSSDAPLIERFQRLYGDCEVDGDRASGLRVICRVGSSPDVGISSDIANVAVDVHDAEPVDLGHFMETAFVDRGCRRMTSAAEGDGWQGMACAQPPLAASRLFARHVTSPALTAIVFLDGFSAEPELTPLPATFGALSKLTPVTSTLWGRPQAVRAFALMKLLASAPSYLLRPGPPDATIPLIEHAFAG